MDSWILAAKLACFWLFLMVSSGVAELALADTHDPTGAALRAQLRIDHELTYSPLPFSSTSEFDVWDALMIVDEDPNSSDNVLLIHSARSEPKSSYAENPSLPPGANPWLPEHSWPNSSIPALANSDLHNLHPVDSDVSAARSGTWYGIANPLSGLYQNPAHPEAPGTSQDELVWEVREDHKGAAARSVAYFYTMYENRPEIIEPISAFIDPSILLIWHLADPVTAEELARSAAISTYQGNSNPFVVGPSDLLARAFPPEVPSMSTMPLAIACALIAATGIALARFECTRR